MTYLLFSKILKGKMLDFKFKEELWTILNINDEKCFYLEFLFLCKTMFLLKMVRKGKKKKSTKEIYMWNSEFWLNKVD